MNKKGIVFTSIITYLAVFALFLGVLSSTAIDILNIFAHPFTLEPWKVFIIDVASMVTNSQNTIAKSIDEFAAADTQYKTFLTWRIIGSSLITLVFLWGAWKGLKHLVPGYKADLGTKLLIFILSVIIVWMIGLTASILSGQGVPSFGGFYNGWIKLIFDRDIFIQYLIKAIAKG